MRVLITGATGQMGRALMRTLAQKHDLRGTCFSRESKSLLRLDLRDAVALQRAFGTDRLRLGEHPLSDVARLYNACLTESSCIWRNRR